MSPILGGVRQLCNCLTEPQSSGIWTLEEGEPRPLPGLQVSEEVRRDLQGWDFLLILHAAAIRLGRGRVRALAPLLGVEPLAYVVEAVGLAPRGVVVGGAVVGALAVGGA